MFESILEIFTKPKCAHDKVSPNVGAAYCPDCGEYVENHWYITRCSCCGQKQKSLFRNGKIVASTHYCKNCGSSTFKVQLLEKIDIVNINYAVLLKEVVKAKSESFVQTWVENSRPTSMKLIPTF